MAINRPAGKISAAEVFEFELNQIQGMRESASENNLVGLAFSGGGIRSATLSLGVLQALARHRLLGKFDYLSTVSGGGYIGAFFNAMLYHSKGDIDKVQAKLDGSWIDATKLNTRFEEVNFLRQYSNYLTPKVGFTSDTLAAISVWFTNTILNQIVLISCLACISALAYASNSLVHQYLSAMGTPALAALGLVLSLVAFAIAVKESFNTDNNHSRAMAPKPLAESVGGDGKALPTRWWVILLLGWVGVLLMGLWAGNLTEGLLGRMDGHFEQWLTFGEGTEAETRISTFWLVVAALVLMISLGIIVALGVVGRRFFGLYITSFFREWWACLGGLSLSWCAAWLAGFVLFLYLPLRLDYWLSAYPFASVGGWGAITAAAVFLGKSSSTGGLNMQKIKEKVTVFLPWLVIASMVVLVSLGVHKLAVLMHTKLIAGSVEMTVPWYSYGMLAAVFGAICLFFTWRVDVNIFSLHYFYRNRLTRCYLGATNTERQPSAFTGFDSNDEVELAACKHRPVHIVNTALNLTSKANLAWQQRMAASFAFTPYYSGFEFPDGDGGYRPSDRYTRGGGVQLGSVISVSGAAASPNSGYHSAPATAFLMTMFNARLGRWYGNPALPKSNFWLKSGPSLGLGYLAKELFARAGIDSNYVHLSDGGHFENLGIYELVRRKCKLIVAVDAGQDGEYKFVDIGNAIRKCEVDFNVAIQLDLSDLHNSVSSVDGRYKMSCKHYAIGTVRYDDNRKNDGIIIYIKSSLTGSEPSDLINFKLEYPAFPHHSTIDQFFNESQFESYRGLGLHMAERLVSDLEQAIAGTALQAAQILGCRAGKSAGKSAGKEKLRKVAALI